MRAKDQLLLFLLAKKEGLDAAQLVVASRGAVKWSIQFRLDWLEDNHYIYTSLSSTGVIRHWLTEVGRKFVYA